MKHKVTEPLALPGRVKGEWGGTLPLVGRDVPKGQGGRIGARSAGGGGAAIPPIKMTDSNKTIRWKQRFQNLEHAYTQLQKGLAIAKPNDVEKQGIIQSFEFTFELAWKTVKDYLESQSVIIQFPREAIKEAFHYQLIVDGDLWMEMLEKRNQMAHTYDEAAAERALALIRKSYAPALRQAVTFFKQKIS